MRDPAFSGRGAALPRVRDRAPRSGRWLVRMALSLLSLLALVSAVQAQGTGVIEGQVVNGTAGGSEPGAGLQVTLEGFLGGTEVATLQAVTDGEGRFRFEGLDTDPELEYWPEVVYLDVPYSVEEPLFFDGEGATLSATVTVYETTDDDSGIRLDSVHMIAESFGQVLRISEIHLFGNAGDRTYVGSEGEGGQREGLYIPLPEGAVGLAFGEDIPADQYIEVEGGLVDTEPVPPGSETSLTFFSYHLVVAGEIIPMERSFAYPLTILNVLAAQPGLTLNSDQLQFQGLEPFQGRDYGFYTVQDVPANTPLTMEWVSTGEMPAGESTETMPASESGATSTLPTRGNQRLLLWVGFGFAVLAVGGAIVYPLATTRPASAPASASEVVKDPRARRLLAELADLEEGLEAGQIDEATYERERAAKYEALKSL
jgi:hypothetical protein